MRIRKDGLFQFDHAGDTLAYRLNDLGIGRGDDFASLNLGAPDFSRYSVIGDRIRWSDVLPDVDLEVRYIHDILKVDVIVKQTRREAIQSRHAQGWLTAKFDIPSVLVRSQATLNGEAVDLRQDRTALLRSPIQFERNGRVLHKMLPVETYVVDGEGNKIHAQASQTIESAQQWRLSADGPGLAELSANLLDFADAPQGDLVIDPSISVLGVDQTVNYNSIKDTYVLQDSTTDFGMEQVLKLGVNGSYKAMDVLLGLENNSDLFDGAQKIHSAKIRLYYKSTPAVTAPSSRFYKLLLNWVESGAGHATYSALGGYDSSKINTSLLADTSVLNVNGTLGIEDFDILPLFRSHAYTTVSDLEKGFKLREAAAVATWEFHSSESATVAYRPIVSVNLGYEFLELTDVAGPYSEGSAPPAKINNKRYIYINGVPPTGTNVKGKTFAIEAGSVQGLATEFPQSNLVDRVLRDVSGSPVPGSSGTPWVVFEPWGPADFTQSFTVTPSDDWYCNLAFITGTWVEENGSGVPVKVHGVFHAEDDHDGSGHWYGGHPTQNYSYEYARIGYAQSTNGYSFTQVDTSTSTYPAIVNFMPESEWATLGTDKGHIDGAAHPWLYPKGNYLYLFYDRNMNAQWCKNHTPADSAFLKCFLQDPDVDAAFRMHGNYVVSPNICVARASKADIEVSSIPSVNPWKKYYDGGWTEPGVGGNSTPILDFNPTSLPVDDRRTNASVSYNGYLAKETMIVKDRLSSAFESRWYIYLAQNPDLTSWSYGMQLPINEIIAPLNESNDGSS